MSSSSAVKTVHVSSSEPTNSQLPEVEARSFYILFTFLCTKAYDQLDHAIKKNIPSWDIYSFGSNSNEARAVVVDRLLGNFNEIVAPYLTAEDLNPADFKYLQQLTKFLLPSSPLASRPVKRLSSTQISHLRLWQQVRVEGSFWFVGFAKNNGGGALFAYFDEIRGPPPAIAAEDERARMGPDVEPPEGPLLGYEEHVFLVKGLASKFSKVFPKKVIDREEKSSTVRNIICRMGGSHCLCLINVVGLPYFCEERHGVPREIAWNRRASLCQWKLPHVLKGRNNK